ncbi:G-type lectin S-receptor-like serine/threonine-protein kinase At4g27290 isoform X2 [Lycium barbarum]|uniref:G-type lectin S-receptor-like serine/threonine-protein kinase At4g27290 isoform X2 n=1 Tax=Lycium barbarum TaxID=112863 RepID=UPI00293F755B|nr:G-type lectin S-receptor-like serine/threonine-protein kinase At4g27290 isoform X2 [Lycium barbarum]
MNTLIFFFLFTIFSFLQNTYSQGDTITTSQFLKDGQTIVSSDGTFELGFFSPHNTSTNRYVCIWYKQISAFTPVWVANRQVPVKDTSGILKIIEPGYLVLINVTNDTIWSTNTSRTVKNPVAQLLDTGNLVVRDVNDHDPDNFLWQSFDYPGDTLLASMKLGWNLVTGLERYLSSWKSEDNPASGDYTYHCDPTGYPQDLMRKGPNVVYRAGPWNGLRWSGAPNMENNSITSFGLVMNNQEIYYKYELVNKYVVSTFRLRPNGNAMRMIWVENKKGWINYHSADADHCETYNLCGAYGTCMIFTDPVCRCLDKFVPKHPDDWNRADWSSGCVRNHPLNCSEDGFIKYSGVKLPDTRNSWFNETMKLDECKVVCSRNCSCMGYTNLDIRYGGSGCLLWIGELVDIRQLSESGQDIYIRMAASEISTNDGSNRNKSVILAIALPLLVATALLVVGVCLILRRQKKKAETALIKKGILDENNGKDNHSQILGEAFELPLFDLSAIMKATDNFSPQNKIGAGGFGKVYKGVLEGGQEVAVKRLSVTSRQGNKEFKNEVIFIAELQHRNLVKLLGCCIQEEEKILVYEYVPNKSVDLFIFDQRRSTLLDWPKRFNIINGIARGLMYLHEDSRLRIIHRDLKASNVLLDIEMNPKISDFGLARSFGGNETGANTSRVVGTYGYMSPEYAVDGIFSVKSDVFSFGVLVLEIVSGKKNRRFIHPDHNLNLIGHAWMLHREGRSLEIVDPDLVGSCHISELQRSIHVGLLCVQQSPEDRPKMSTVVLMLTNEGILPQPKPPGFFTERNIDDATGYSSSNQTPYSVNDVTITLLDAR